MLASSDGQKRKQECPQAVRKMVTPKESVTQVRGGRDGERLGKGSPIQRPEGLQLEGAEG